MTISSGCDTCSQFQGERGRLRSSCEGNRVKSAIRRAPTKGNGGIFAIRKTPVEGNGGIFAIRKTPVEGNRVNFAIRRALSGVNSVRRRGLGGNFFSFSPRNHHFCTNLVRIQSQAGSHRGNITYYKLYIGHLSPVMRDHPPKEEITYQK